MLIGAPWRLAGGWIDVGPGPLALRPDVRGQLHRRRILDGAGAHHHALRRDLALAVDGRAAVAAEVAVQDAAAVGLLREPLRRALRDAEVLRRHERVDRAARAGDFLAVGAVAGAQFRNLCADAVTNGAAQATADQGGHFANPRKSLWNNAAMIKKK